MRDHTVDGRNPFRTTWKPWETMVGMYRESSFQGLEGGAGVPSSSFPWFQFGANWIPSIHHSVNQYKPGTLVTLVRCRMAREWPSLALGNVVLQHI